MTTVQDFTSGMKTALPSPARIVLGPVGGAIWEVFMHLRRTPEANSAVPLSIEFRAGSTEFSYSTHVIPYMEGSTQIEIVDPHINTFHQVSALRRLIHELAATRGGTPFAVHLETRKPWNRGEQERQRNWLCGLAGWARETYRCQFTWAHEEAIHDRYIESDSWRVHLGTGIDPWRSQDDPLLDHGPEVRSQFFVHYQQLEA